MTALRKCSVLRCFNVSVEGNVIRSLSDDWTSNVMFDVLDKRSFQITVRVDSDVSFNVGIVPADVCMSTAYIWRKHGYHLSPLADPAYVLSGKNGLQTTYAKQTRVPGLLKPAQSLRLTYAAVPPTLAFGIDDAALEKVEFDLPIDPGDYRPMVSFCRRDTSVTIEELEFE